MGMQRPRYNVGKVNWIGAEAVGVPGQRTFRLMVQSDDTTAQMWLEKEQLQRLAEAVNRMLMEIDVESGKEPRTYSGPSTSNPKPDDFPAQPDIEFQIGTLGLRYDPQRDLIAIEAFDRMSDEGDPPTLLCTATRKQMDALQASSLEVIAAGRPRCPLCHTPLSAPGMPHFCPPTNGFQKLTDEEEEEG